MDTIATEKPRPLATRLIILFAICCSSAAMPLTFTGPAVALPAISRSLGGEPSSLAWVTNAFMLTFGSTLMMFGSLADTYGRKRVYLTGLSFFALFSAALAFAPGIVPFDILRALQGFGAAAAFASGMALLAQEFTDEARMRAFSVVGASFGVGLAFGPIASGMMIEMFGWPSIFALVVGLAVIALSFGTFLLRDSRNPNASSLDWLGAASFSLALTLLTYAVLRAPGSGWSDPVVLASLLGAILLMFAFYRIERSVKQPMLDLTLFRYPRFVGVQLLAAAPAYAFVVLLVLLPVRFVGIEGMDEVAAGRLMIALSGPLLLLPVAAGLLTRWLSAAAICGIGLVVSAIGLLWLSSMPIGTDASSIVWPLLVIGIGISLPWGLMDGLAVSVVPKERAGMATGIFSTTRVAGEGVALAIVTAVLSGLTQHNLAAETAARAAVASQRLVTGDLANAVQAVPHISAVALIQHYSEAYSLLLLLLGVVTMATATVVILFLRKGADTSLSNAFDCESTAR